MNTKNQLQIYPTVEALSEAAAGLMSRIAVQSIQEKGRFVISLSGGSTPERLYMLLSKPPFSVQFPWSQTFVFWGDERYVPADDKRNNSRMAKSLLLDKVEIAASNIYPVPVNATPAEAAAEYEKTIRDFFGNESPRFDLMLLGLGENGHTASLFPGTEVLHETSALVKEVYIEEQKMFRITMTVPLINLSRNIVFLVAGEAKAQILSAVLTGSYQPATYPAQLIKPVNGDLFWMADMAAAAAKP